MLALKLHIGNKRVDSNIAEIIKINEGILNYNTNTLCLL